MNNRFGIIGITIGMIALSAAFLSPWIADMVAPPKPTEEAVVDFAAKLKDAAMAKATGKEYTPEPEDFNPRQMVAPTIIGTSMLATFFGVIGIVRDEKKTAGGMAACLGLAAAVVQWSIILASVIIFVLLVGLILGALGIDLPF